MQAQPSDVQHTVKPGRLTNVDDVTQDQPNLRALRAIAVSAFPSTAFHLATSTPPHQHRHNNTATTTPTVSSGRFAAGRRIDA
jgi:hypothetical protein